MEGLRIASLALGFVVIFGFITPGGLSIKCYHCNSAYDPRCADPFDKYTIGEVDCDMREKLNHVDKNATVCRKIVQKVNGVLRYIRTCGYIGGPSPENGRQCIARSGTYEVHVSYCACEGDFCNAAPKARDISDLLFSIVTMITLKKLTTAIL